MNILHVVNVCFALPYFIGDQLNYMRDKGHKMYIVCSPAPQLKSFANKYSSDYREVEILRKFSILSDIKAIFHICKYIYENHIDVVNGHTPKAGMLAMVAAFCMRVPKRIYFRHGLLYETSHGIKRNIFIFSERLASFFATDVVCVSQYLKEKSNIDKLTSYSKLKILYKGSCNGIDVYGHFNPNNIDIDILNHIRQKYHLTQKSWVIGYTGRLVKDKGIVELVKAYAILKQKYDDIFLLLVGPMEERDCLPNEIVEFIHSDERIITPGLIEKGIEYYYAIMNVLVLATHREGLGSCLLEASSMQLPVLTTSHTGSRDAIINNETGLFVDLSPISIANKIELLHNNESLAKKMGISGRKFVASNFEQHLIWSEIEKLYHL